MERSEPTLVPEWLRSTGGATGVGGSMHHSSSSSSSSSHSAPLVANSARNRSSRSISDLNRSRSTISDRSSSSNSRRISNGNGSPNNPSSSFSRNHRDRDQDREKERSAVMNHWDQDGLDILGNGKLQRSQSMISGDQEDLFPRNGRNVHALNGNGVLSGSSLGARTQKVTFEKDFPSLGTDEKHGVHSVGKASLPTAAQGLPVVNSFLKGGEGWSVLAEVPIAAGGNNVGPPSTCQPAASPAPSNTVPGLNMAEALAQAPARAHTAPQLSAETQWREELAIKQSRVLIPMTPSVPKALVLNSFDKSKPKTSVRNGDIISAVKSGQQQLPSLLNLSGQSPRGINGRSDAPRMPQGGKFLVLKPAWENGPSPSSKDVLSPSNNAASSPVSVSPAPKRNLNNPKVFSGEHRAAAVTLNLVSNLEKKPSSSQSRIDFFNNVRKKSSTNNSVLPDPSTAISSNTMDKSCETFPENPGSPASPAIQRDELLRNGKAIEDRQKNSDNGGKNFGVVAAFSPVPDEEEVAFLRSLGWEENAGVDGLTEEEINEFYELHMNKLSLKICEGSKPISQC